LIIVITYIKSFEKSLTSREFILGKY